MKRRGASLVETLVIMSMASTVLTLSVLVLHRSMRAASLVHTFHETEASAWRLSGQLRRDVYAAARATVVDGLLTLTQPDDQEITYRFEESEVVRTNGRNALSPGDMFRVGRVPDWRVEVTRSPATLVVESAPARSGARSPPSFRLVARLRSAPRNGGAE